MYCKPSEQRGNGEDDDDGDEDGNTEDTGHGKTRDGHEEDARTEDARKDGRKRKRAGHARTRAHERVGSGACLNASRRFCHRGNENSLSRKPGRRANAIGTPNERTDKRNTEEEGVREERDLI